MTTDTRKARAAKLIGEVADDIAYGATFGKVSAMDFIEAVGADAEDIANLICGDEEANLNVRDRLRDCIIELATAYFTDGRGRAAIEDQLDAEDEEDAPRLRADPYGPLDGVEPR